MNGSISSYSTILSKNAKKKKDTFFKVNVFSNICIFERLYCRTLGFSNFCIFEHLYFRTFDDSNI